MFLLYILHISAFVGITYLNVIIPVFQSSEFVIPCCLISYRCSKQYQTPCSHLYHMATHTTGGPQTTGWETTSLTANSPTQDLPDLASYHVLYEERESRCNYWLKLDHSLLGRLAAGPAPPVGAQHGSVATEAVDEAAMSCNVTKVQFKTCTYFNSN